MTDETTPRSFGLRSALLLAALWILLSLLLAQVVAFITRQAGYQILDLNVAISLINTLTTAAVILFALRRYRLPARALLPRPAPPAQLLPILLCVAGATVVLSFLDSLLQRYLPMPSDFFEQMLDLVTGSHVLLVFLTLSVVAPLTEELLFRGVILGGLRARYSDGAALAASSVLFGLVHMNPWQFVTASLLGLLLGWWVIRTGNLTQAILGHAIFNFFPLLALRLGGENIEDYAALEQGAGQPPGVTLAGLALLALGLWLSARWMGRKAGHQNPSGG